MSLTAIAFLAAYFGCLFRAFSKDPKWGLYAYLLAFYAHPVGRWWGQSLPDLRWSFLAALVTLVAVFFSKKKGALAQLKRVKVLPSIFALPVSSIPLGAEQCFSHNFCVVGGQIFHSNSFNTAMFKN